MSFEEVHISVPWGNINGKWWGPKNKQPIIAMHGWQDNCGTFDLLIPHLSPDQSYLCIDLPGHGFSSHYPKGMFYYLFQDGVILVRRIVKHFKWENIILMGHSLGGAIAFLYAASFPEETKAIISIDIVAPPIRKDENIVADTGPTIDRFLKYENIPSDKIPNYEKKEMVDVVYEAHRGSITKESAEVLMKRGMKPSKQGHFMFTRDVRLKFGIYFGTLSPSLVLAYASQITCQVLNIKAVPGRDFINGEYYFSILDKIKEKSKRLVIEEVPGTHHLHLNDPKNVAIPINRFLFDL